MTREAAEGKAGPSKRVSLVEVHNVSPHLETGFEIAKRHLDQGDHVTYVFLGHDTPYRKVIFPNRLESVLYRR